MAAMARASRSLPYGSNAARAMQGKSNYSGAGVPTKMRVQS
jgi:hypothetical protein